MPDQLCSSLAVRHGLPMKRTRGSQKGKGRCQRQMFFSDSGCLCRGGTLRVDMVFLSSISMISNPHLKRKRKKGEETSGSASMKPPSSSLCIANGNLVILKPYRQQVWPLGINSWGMTSCTTSVSVSTFVLITWNVLGMGGKCLGVVS